MAKIKESHFSSLIDQNGELIELNNSKTISWGAEPNYIKLYLDDILYLSDIPQQNSKVLYELLKKATYADDTHGMEIVINSALKRRIQEKLGFKSEASVSNAISKLKKGGVLLQNKDEKGIYQLNPYLFGKGDWSNIARLRLEVTYDVKGKTFKTVCEYKDQQPERSAEQCQQNLEASKLA